jgi:sortase (surface protein transpeptidase)
MKTKIKSISLIFLGAACLSLITFNNSRLAAQEETNNQQQHPQLNQEEIENLEQERDIKEEELETDLNESEQNEPHWREAPAPAEGLDENVPEGTDEEIED